MITADEQESKELLIRRAVFGKQVENFLSSDEGKYLLHRADNDVQTAFEGLKSCDPKDGKMVQTFQNMIYRAESVKQWLTDAVVDGLNATNIIEDRE